MLGIFAMSGATTYRNLVDLHRRQAERFGPRPAIRFKRYGLYHDLPWEDYDAQTLACAAALADAGIAAGDRVGLLAENSVEWLIADMGILAAAAVNVPPHAPLTPRQIQFQLAEAGVRWLFVSTAEQLDKVRKVRAELPALKGVVIFDRACAAQDCVSWPGFLQKGRQVLSRWRQELGRREAGLAADALATIMYTSGTTGNPKGVMLTHGNLLSNALACHQTSPRGPEAVILNWLPLSHIYARTIDHYLSLVSGVTTCLAESPETVVQNLAEVQPTHIASVPRFYEKVLAAVAAPDPETTGKRLRAIFGPRIDWLGSGGAPLPLSVARAYQEAGLLLLQGYGLTESSPVISFNHKESYKIDTVGQAIPGVEVKIAADGEILTRGPHVMPGYWKRPEATAETIKDGWLHTGDLGSLDADGFLTITGRKKELIVMSNGLKVAPTQVEGLLVADPCIDQVVVHGEGRSFLTALIVPNWNNVRGALAAQGERTDPSEDTLAKSPAVQELLAKCIAVRLADLSSCEQVKRFVVLARPFSVAAEELTVSLKLRRSIVLEKHRLTLNALYPDAAPGEG
jgi:long-chain acyl-CoA synthetase